MAYGALRQTRPLTYFTYWLNYQVGGGDPLGYHLLNLALHLGVVLLLFECLRRLVPETAAAVAAAIFAVHPIQAEAVNYVWARAIVLAALLCLAALCEWIGGRVGGGGVVRGGPVRERGSGGVSAGAGGAAGGPRGGCGAGCGDGGAFGGGGSARDLGDYGDAAGVQAGLSPWRYLLAQGTVICALYAAGGGAVRVHGGSRYTRRRGGVGAGADRG